MSLAGDILAAPARLGAVRLVAVDGPTGAGKSTLAARLADDLRTRSVATAVVPTDHFATWDDPVAWWPRLVEGVLNPLENGVPGAYQRTEWPGGAPSPGAWITVGVPEVLIVEGVSSGRRSAHPRLSRLIWVEFGDFATRLQRSVARDGESSRAELVRWQAFESGWFTVDDTRARACVRVRS
ncbi:uridine kinase family protein [Actinokineospora sp.]|uniref:uridine kinase family protein n=1 Tax=Actinokineospora sp. TaxID=1872133 RepID=UPI003D6A2E36